VQRSDTSDGKENGDLVTVAFASLSWARGTVERSVQ
jgi:hypothetical protein